MTSRFQPPPVIKACERLLVDLEDAVRQFPRYHRYAVGADLRKAAAATYSTANRAWRDQAGRQQWVDRLVWQVDELKMYLQVAAVAIARHFGLSKILDDQDPAALPPGIATDTLVLTRVNLRGRDNVAGGRVLHYTAAALEAGVFTPVNQHDTE